MTIRLGLQIPNFSYGTGVEQLFPTVIAQAREAESAGFDSVSAIHFRDPKLGSPDYQHALLYTGRGHGGRGSHRVVPFHHVDRTYHRE